MKKILFRSLFLGGILLFSSCGINTAIINNQNQNTTQVQLAGNNFRVIDKVSGSAEVSYVLFIGGLNKKQLYENAYSVMMDKANLKDGARAIINVVTEEHLGGVVPFYFKRTVTVSAHIVEFTK